MSALDEARRQLYQTAPDEFVTARDSLAKALRASGDKETAAALKAERRPTRILWALRAAPAEHTDAVERFVAAATAAASALGGSGAGLREHTAALRESVGDLAREVARGAGVDRAELASALLSVASDADALTELREGTLAEVPDAFGWGMLPTEPPEPEPAPAAPEPEPEPEPEPDPAAVERAAAARKARDRAQVAVDAAAAELADARAALDAARQELTDAEGDLA
jgi:hypothetical protein